MRRRGKLPFVPQDSGPTGWGLGPLGPVGLPGPGRSPSVLMNNTTSQILGGPNLTTGPYGGNAAPTAAIDRKKEVEVPPRKQKHDSPSQALLKLSKANDKVDHDGNALALATTVHNAPSTSSDAADPPKPALGRDNDASATAIDPELQFYVMDYAAGIALRNGVLLALAETETSDKSVAQLAVELGRFYRGEGLLQKSQKPADSGKSVYASSRIENVEAEDAAVLSSWFFDSVGKSGGDKYLPHTNILWSEKWEQRCLDGTYNPDHEMIKLVVNHPNSKKKKHEENEKDRITPLVLGVAYIERHSFDPTAECKSLAGATPVKDSARATVIREMRLHPSCNPAVQERLQYCRETLADAADEGEFELLPFNHLDILSCLLENILNRSLLYGTSGITVLCPKQEMLEQFYKTKMGKPVAMDENGRFIFRSHGKERMENIQSGFERHMVLVDAAGAGNEASEETEISSAAKRGLETDDVSQPEKKRNRVDSNKVTDGQTPPDTAIHANGEENGGTMQRDGTTDGDVDKPKDSSVRDI
jgi:hypothetical protein